MVVFLWWTHHLFLMVKSVVKSTGNRIEFEPLEKWMCLHAWERLEVPLKKNIYVKSVNLFNNSWLEFGTKLFQSCQKTSKQTNICSFQTWNKLAAQAGNSPRISDKVVLNSEMERVFQSGTILILKHFEPHCYTSQWVCNWCESSICLYSATLILPVPEMLKTNLKKETQILFLCLRFVLYVHIASQYA